MSLDQEVKSALLAVSIFEKGSRASDVILSWCYPSLTEELTAVIERRTLLDATPLPFSFSKFKDEWIFILTVEQPQHGGNDVSHVSFVITAKEFNPEKYERLLQLLSSLYRYDDDDAALPSPIPLLKQFLKIFLYGKASFKKIDASFDDAAAEFDPRQAMLGSPLGRAVIVPLAEQCSLLWCAMLMKRRVVVLSDSVDKLLSFIRAVPLLVFHRRDWSPLRPFNSVAAEDVADLKRSQHFVAGFTDSEIAGHPKMWDLLIDLETREVTVSDSARADFAQLPFHQEMANFMVKTAQEEENDQEVIKAVLGKTKALLAKLNSLKDAEGKVTAESLGELPSGFSRFLFNVAAAESLT